MPANQASEQNQELCPDSVVLSVTGPQIELTIVPQMPANVPIGNRIMAAGRGQGMFEPGLSNTATPSTPTIPRPPAPTITHRPATKKKTMVGRMPRATHPRPMVV